MSTKKKAAKTATKKPAKKVAAAKKELSPKELTALRLKEAKTTDAMDEAAKLLKQGKSVAEVVKATKLSKSYVYWAKRVHGVETKAPAKKAAAKKTVTKKEAAPKVEVKREAEASNASSAIEIAKQNAKAKLPQEQTKLEEMKASFTAEQKGQPFTKQQSDAIAAQTNKIKNMEILAK